MTGKKVALGLPTCNYHKIVQKLKITNKEIDVEGTYSLWRHMLAVN